MSLPQYDFVTIANSKLLCFFGSDKPILVCVKRSCEICLLFDPSNDSMVLKLVLFFQTEVEARDEIHGSIIW